MIKAVFLDMDDTLNTSCNLYEHSAAMLFGYLRHFGVDVADANRVQKEIDKELYKAHGYSRTRYPATFEAVLRHFVPEPDAEMVSIVRDLAEKVFVTPALVKPGTQEAVELLARHFPVYIVTGGDHSVQQPRIDLLPFKDKITRAFIVDKKDKDTYDGILGTLGLKPEEAVMIGDSLKSDVIAPVAAGMQAVWIEAENSQFEKASDFPAQRAYKFASLSEAARHLVRYKTPAPPADWRKAFCPVNRNLRLK